MAQLSPLLFLHLALLFISEPNVTVEIHELCSWNPKYPTDAACAQISGKESEQYSTGPFVSLGDHQNGPLVGYLLTILSSPSRDI